MPQIKLPVSKLLKESSAAGADQLYAGVKAVSLIANPKADLDWVEEETTRLTEEVRSTGLTLKALREVLLRNGHCKASLNQTDAYSMSDLDSVLRTGEGLPITVAMIVLEICRRLKIESHGINAPTVFLLSIEKSVVHPRGLKDIDYEKQTQAHREQNILVPEATEVATNSIILSRMFRNLCVSASSMQEYVRAFEFCDYLDLINPGSWLVHLDRARVWLEIGDHDSVLYELRTARGKAKTKFDIHFIDSQLQSLESGFDEEPGLVN